MTNPLINIIIPVYNAENTLAECLLSVKRQSYKNWKALIVDDASSDKSRKIIEQFAKEDPRFTYMYNNTNKGASFSRNKALDNIDGEYTAFLDSDDRWEPDMLLSLCEAALKYDSDIVQCRFQYDYPGGKEYVPKGCFDELKIIEKKDFKKIYYKMLTGINMNHVCMKLIKSDMIGKIRFYPQLKTAEDLAFCAELFTRADRYVFINQVLYRYFRGGTGLTGHGLNFSEKWKCNRAVSSIIIENMKKLNMASARFYILAFLRPYIITISKIFRILCEKTFTRHKAV